MRLIQFHVYFNHHSCLCYVTTYSHLYKCEQLAAYSQAGQKNDLSGTGDGK